MTHTLIINGKEVPTPYHAPTPEVYEYIRHTPDLEQMEWRYDFRSGERFWVTHQPEAKYFRIVVSIPGYGTDETIFRQGDPQAELYGWTWGAAGTIARHRINEIYDEIKAQKKKKAKPEAVQLTLDF